MLRLFALIFRYLFLLLHSKRFNTKMPYCNIAPQSSSLEFRVVELHYVSSKSIETAICVSVWDFHLELRGKRRLHKASKGKLILIVGQQKYGCVKWLQHLKCIFPKKKTLYLVIFIHFNCFKVRYSQQRLWILLSNLFLFSGMKLSLSIVWHLTTARLLPSSSIITIKEADIATLFNHCTKYC